MHIRWHGGGTPARLGGVETWPKHLPFTCLRSWPYGFARSICDSTQSTLLSNSCIVPCSLSSLVRRSITLGAPSPTLGAGRQYHYQALYLSKRHPRTHADPSTDSNEEVEDTSYVAAYAGNRTIVLYKIDNLTRLNYVHELANSKSCSPDFHEWFAD